MKCEYCKSDHTGNFGTGRFCCSKCAKGFSTSVNRESINLKVSSALSGKSRLRKYPPADPRNCLNCGTEFTPVNNKPKQKCCSKICSITVTNRKRGVIGGLKSAVSQSRRSKNEILFADLCNRHFSDVETNKQMFNGWDADVILHKQRVAIMWNGAWHYKKLNKNHNLQQVETRDKIKLQSIIEAGYTPYVIKDLGKADAKFVTDKFNEFLNWLREVDSNAP